MLTGLTNPFKARRACGQAHANSEKVAVGLQSLVHTSEGRSNVVMKSAVRKQRIPAAQACKVEFWCQKSCSWCCTTLRLDKDVYMYRGDQGFCSIECRERQIRLDGRRESESSTKQMIKSYRHCSGDDRRETRLLLQELGRRHKSHPHQNHWTIVSS